VYTIRGAGSIALDHMYDTMSGGAHVYRKHKIRPVTDLLRETHILPPFDSTIATVLVVGTSVVTNTVVALQIKSSSIRRNGT
jgi:hypothetical protein